MLSLHSILVAGILAAISVTGRGTSAPQPMGSTAASRSNRPGREERSAGETQGPAVAAAQAKLRAERMQAIQLEILRLRQTNTDITIHEINRLQLEHHELMKEIIRNIAPSGHYEFNPATGRYDRYVPNRR